MKTSSDSPAALGSRHPAGGRVLHCRRRRPDIVPAVPAADDADRRGGRRSTARPSRSPRLSPAALPPPIRRSGSRSRIPATCSMPPRPSPPAPPILRWCGPTSATCSQARTVALTAHGVVMIVAPPGSTITSIAKLRDHTVGVVGGEINHGVVEVLKKEYDLGRANVVFKDIAPADARRAMQTKEVSALLLVMPLTDKYLSFVKGLFREGPNSSAGPDTDRFRRRDRRCQGAVRKLRYSQGHAARRAAGSGRRRHHPAGRRIIWSRTGISIPTVVAELTKKVMSVRRDLVGEQPLLAGIAAPDTRCRRLPRRASGRGGVLQRHPGKLHGPLWQRHLSDADGARRARVGIRGGVAISRGSRRSKPRKPHWTRCAACRGGSARSTTKPNSRRSRTKSMPCCAPSW